MIASDILPWHSGFSGFELGWLSGFEYWFPLFGGIVILVGTIIGYYMPKQQIPTVLTQFFGLSLVLIFLVDYLGNNWQFLSNAQAGFYSLVIGISIIFLDIISALLAKQNLGPTNMVN